jgi:hypothetical protein
MGRPKCFAKGGVSEYGRISKMLTFVEKAVFGLNKIFDLPTFTDWSDQRLYLARQSFMRPTWRELA